jgi:acyl-coenzyme A synthetase/AMP-(fatty) acid ligase
MSLFTKKLLQRFAQLGQINAIIHNKEVYSYIQLETHIFEWLKYLKDKDIKRGQIVSLIGDYSFTTISLFLALFENGNIIVPITSKVDSEKNERINISQSDVVLEVKESNCEFTLTHVAKQKHPLINSLINNSVSGLILFSSGSTGKPKAMIHDLDSLVNSYLDRKPKNINFLVFLMFDHIGGINTLLNCLSMGAIITIPDSRNPEEICKLIQEYKVQVLPSSPTFLNLLLISGCDKKYDLSSLILITYGTEPMPESLLNRLKEVFKRTKFLQTFGTSETGILKTSSKSNTSTLLKIEDGLQEIKIVEGELWIRSKTQILGYLNYESNNFTSDGWFKTGDLVKQEPDNYIRIIGRLKEIINVGGEKVLPQEVESILMEIEFIQDATVYAMPSPIVGEAVAVNIVLNKNIQAPENAKVYIRNFCKSKLESYKVPVKVNIVEKLAHSERFKKLRNI